MINRFFSFSLPLEWQLRHQHYLRVLIILVVILLSTALAFWGSERHLSLLLLLLLGIGSSLLFLRWPPIGIAILIIGSLVVPFEIGTGTQTSLNITVFLLSGLISLWLLDMIARRRRLQLKLKRPVLALLSFVTVSFLSFGVGQLPWFDFAKTAPLHAQLGGLAVFLLSSGAFLLVAFQVRNLKWLKRLTWIFLILGGLYIVERLAPRLNGNLLQFTHGSTGSLFWVWLVTLAFSQAVFNRRLHQGWRLVLGGLVLATFYVSLFQARSWASGWLPPLVALLAVLWVGATRQGLLITLVGGVVAAINLQKIIGLIMINEQYSWITRMEAWRIVVQIVKVSPILGLGPANYSWYTPLFPILGWSVQFNSHNQYVDIIAQTGLLGLICFSWFVWELGRMGWRLRAHVPEGFAQAYVYGALGGLVGTLAAGMLADWVLPFVYNITLSGMRASILGWLFLGGLVSLESITARES